MTVIVAVPFFRPLTTPLLTVATVASLLAQVRFLLVASAGATVALSVVVLPILIVAEVLSKLTPVTATACTVTSQEADLPLAVVAVIVVLPAVTPVTLPLASTVATASLSDFQVNALPVLASAGL